MTPKVEKAIQEIRVAFRDNPVVVEENPDGGAYVIVQDVVLGYQYNPSTSWIGFGINFQYPYSDVYPHYIESGVKRADNSCHGIGFSGPINWQGRSVIQVSRRSPNWNPAQDIAAEKLAKVLDWINTR